MTQYIKRESVKTYQSQIERDVTTTFYYSDAAMTVLHREDGPAVECTNGNKYWYRNGKHHREDGPASVYSDGREVWYLNDVYVTKEEFAEALEVESFTKTIAGVKYKLVKA